jgi:Xaa-Pro aminopeptidase
MFDASTYVARRTKLRQQFKHGLLLFIGNNDSPMNYTDNTYHGRTRRSSTTGALTIPSWRP